MALNNFILTVAGLGAVFLMMRGDVRHTATTLRQNVKQLRHWIEKETPSVSKTAEKAKPKELNSEVSKKDVLKED